MNRKNSVRAGGVPMTITKIKTKDDKIHIEYRVVVNGETDEYSLTCSQPRNQSSIWP